MAPFRLCFVFVAILLFHSSLAIPIPSDDVEIVTVTIGTESTTPGLSSLLNTGPSTVSTILTHSSTLPATETSSENGMQTDSPQPVALDTSTSDPSNTETNSEFVNFLNLSSNLLQTNLISESETQMKVTSEASISFATESHPKEGQTSTVSPNETFSLGLPAMALETSTTATVESVTITTQHQSQFQDAEISASTITAFLDEPNAVSELSESHVSTTEAQKEQAIGTAEAFPESITTLVSSTETATATPFEVDVSASDSESHLIDEGEESALSQRSVDGQEVDANVVAESTPVTTESVANLPDSRDFDTPSEVDSGSNYPSAPVFPIETSTRTQVLPDPEMASVETSHDSIISSRSDAILSDQVTTQSAANIEEVHADTATTSMPTSSPTTMSELDFSANGQPNFKVTHSNDSLENTSSTSGSLSSASLGRAYSGASQGNISLFLAMMAIATHYVVIKL